MKAEIRDSLAPLYPDSTVSESPCRRATMLDVARGSTAAVHVLVTDLPPCRPIHLEARVATSPGGIGSLRPQWFELVAVPVRKNTGIDGFVEPPGQLNPHVIRRAPFRVYDVLRPVPRAIRGTGAVMAFRLHLGVPSAARPGICGFDLAVRCGGEEARLRLNVRVHRAAVPPVGPESFPYTNWFSYANIASRHGVRPWSEGHWRMLRAYADLMVRGRQNMFWIPLDVVFDRRAGRPVLRTERLERIVRTFTEAGMHWIEGGHFASRTGGEWKATTYDLGMHGPRATSEPGNEELAAVAGQLLAAIRKNRWERRWLQHVADEPIAENATDYRILAGMVRKYMPGIRLVDATMNETLVGSLDVWCPRIDHFSRGRRFFDAQRSVGDRVWYYTCCAPGGAWLNRLLDHGPIRPALYGWAAARFGLEGFLHWGLNHYGERQDPFEQSEMPLKAGSYLPAGDMHVVYPGNGEPWSSVRFEAAREGFEDWELLHLLARAKLPAAQRIVAGVIRNLYGGYTRDPGVLRAARRSLLAACDRLRLFQG